MGKGDNNLQQGDQKSLQDIFLYQKGKETNCISIMRGFHFVTEELVKRLEVYEEDHWLDYFFDQSNEPVHSFNELMEFWGTAKVYVGYLSKSEKSQYSKLFSLIYEIDSHYYCFRYWKVRDEMGEQFEERLEALCYSIEEIYNNRFINILDLKMNLKYKVSLKRFEESINDLDYMFIKHCLAEAMIDGGVGRVSGVFADAKCRSNEPKWFTR